MTKRKYPERKSSYQRLSSAFRSVIDNFKIAASKTDKRETTIQAEANNGYVVLIFKDTLGMGNEWFRELLGMKYRWTKCRLF